MSPDKPKLIKIPATKRPSLLKARLLSPFLERYRIRLALLREPVEMQDVYPSGLMTGDRKLLFLKNNKAGSTSVAQLLIHYSTGSYVKMAHSYREGIHQGLLGSNKIRDGFNSADTFCFTITRNPLERLLSCFFNLFVDGCNNAAAVYLPSIKARGFVTGGDIQRNLEVFVDFIEESMSDDRLMCNVHWREQHVNIGYGNLPYDHIAKLENYSKDIRHVFESAGLGNFLDRVDWERVRNRSSRSDLSIPPKLVSRVEQIYAKDYELFGY